MATAHIELTRDIGGNRHQYQAAEAIDSLNQALAQIRLVNGVIAGYMTGGSGADIEAGFNLQPGQGSALASAFATLASTIDVAPVQNVLNELG